MTEKSWVKKKRVVLYLLYLVPFLIAVFSLKITFNEREFLKDNLSTISSIPPNWAFKLESKSADGCVIFLESAGTFWIRNAHNGKLAYGSDPFCSEDFKTGCIFNTEVSVSPGVIYNVFSEKSVYLIDFTEKVDKVVVVPQNSEVKKRAIEVLLLMFFLWIVIVVGKRVFW